MSDTVTGSIGAASPGHYGAAGTGVTLTPLVIATAWNVQGDPARESFFAEAERRFGVALPHVPNTTARAGGWTALWIGPRSWLVAGAGALATGSGDFTAHRDALNASGSALFDVSASRSACMVSGPCAAAVLAASCPLDFHPSVFSAGRCAQSVLGHVSVLIEKPTAAPAFIVMVARSLAADGWRTLCVAAAQFGYDVAPATYYR